MKEAKKENTVYTWLALLCCILDWRDLEYLIEQSLGIGE
jgi:hypothetical protein